LEKPITLVVIDNFITAGAIGRETIESPNIEFIEHDASEPFDWTERLIMWCTLQG